MTETIAGTTIPGTAAATEATDAVRAMTSPLVFHHSRRVFLFGTMLADAWDDQPDPELLYLAALFHDTGLASPYPGVEQRFELDGADHARDFMRDRGYPATSTETVWTAIALHTTPAVPARMGPVVAALNAGVLVDAVGLGLERLDRTRVDEVLAAHPRGHFKDEFLRAFVSGLEHRPDTTYGTVNADVLERFVPTFQRGSMVDRIRESPWPT